MEKNRGVIRELLKYEFELGHSVKEAIENINRAKGVGTVAQRTAYEWYSNFKKNQVNIEDKKRSGRAREVDCRQRCSDRLAPIFVLGPKIPHNFILVSDGRFCEDFKNV
ncbi:histone-lysine N-methyltransferase SETMAR [Ditylenchus destructor]|uniref:Histone-lysine N-methyltransferase SETMAR n=1 Tax=Ditylenchus destructor TaxID=166010 RepID=A0AAD4MXS4_9BILA|nr:histone-lysine N-methyltransferase SETMAR [Ditylenchus destructor]